VPDSFKPELSRAGAITTLLIVGFLLFPSSGRDDVFITAWVADGLREHGQILNYNGEFVEQGSSLLHALLSAGLAAITGISSVAATRLTALLAGIATVAVIGSTIRCSTSSRVSDGLATWLVATCPFFVYWSFGGLDATLAALTYLLLFQACETSLVSNDLTISHGLALAASMAAFLMSRPEAIPVVFFILLGLFVSAVFRQHLLRPENRPNLSLRKWGLLSVNFVTLSAALIGFRVIYFGSALPQPVAAKSGISFDHLLSGFRYFAFGIPQSAPFYAIALLLGFGCLVHSSVKSLHSPSFPSRHLLLSLFVGVYLSFAFFSGGDWMEGARFLVPIVPLVALLTAEHAQHILGSQNIRPVGIVAVVCFQLIGTFQLAHRQSTSVPIWTEIQSSPSLKEKSLRKWPFVYRRNRLHVRDIPISSHLNGLVESLSDGTSQNLVVISGQMGMNAYELARRNYGDVHFVDLRSLTTRHISKCSRSMDIKRGFAGFQMTLSRYLAQKPHLQRTCDLPDPDILYGLNRQESQKPIPELLAERGYTRIFRQTGAVRCTDSLFCPPDVAKVRQFIAIRNTLIEDLEENSPEGESRR
jgi:hypothetical protein